MTKIDSLDTITSGYLSNSQINNNFTKVVSALDNTVSRDGSSPNTLSANLDMNNNTLINLATPTTDFQASTKKYVDDNAAYALSLGDAATAAAASASSAATSETNASTYSSSALTSANNAASFANVFSTYETPLFQSPYSADATGVTGNATEVQTALDNLETAGGGVASFRAGLLNIDGNVNINRHTMLQGVYDERAFNNRQATANATGISGVSPNTGLHITDTTNTGSTSGADATFTFDSNAGGVKNSLVSYPNQTLVSTTPITEYAPTFGFSGNQIGFTLQNLQLLNPYIGLKMEGQGNGFGLIENVQTRPFKIGFWLDRVNEHISFRNISAWTWGGTNDAILDRHLNDTVVEFKLGFIDAVTFENIGTYDRKTTFHLYNNGSGSPWMNVSNCHIDNNVKPIVIEDANIANFNNLILVGDNEELEDGNAGIEITSDFSEDSGRVNFSNVDIFNTAHGIINRATTGTFNFSNISIKTEVSATGAGRYDDNAVRTAAFIDEGGGAFNKISNLARGGRQTWEGIFADNNTIIDGTTLPDRETEITSLSGWDTGASWDDKANWTNNTNITNITDGLQFDLTGGIVTAAFYLPTLFEVEKMFVLEFELEQDFATSSTPAATITPAAVEGLITITADSSVFAGGDVGKYITGNGGEARIVTYNSGTEVLVSVLEPFTNTTPITTTNWFLEDRAAVESGVTFGVGVANGASYTTKHLDNSFVPRWKNKTKLIFPVIVPDASAAIGITFGGQVSGTALMKLTNMKMYRPSRESVTSSFLEAIYGTDRYSTVFGKFFDVKNGKYHILSDDGIPTTGTFEAGDTITDTSTGETHYCVVGGASGGTWITHTPQEVLTGTETHDWVSLAHASSQTNTITVTGAEVGDLVLASIDVDQQGTSFSGYVSSANTVTVVQNNNTGSAVDLASATNTVKVFKK